MSGSTSTFDDHSSCEGSCCGEDMYEECMPFSFVISDDVSTPDMEDSSFKIESMTLLEGQDCVVWLEHADFGKICLGRLLQPYAVNLPVAMDFVPAEDVTISVKSNGEACKVAITGLIQLEDGSDSEDGSESDDEEQHMTIEEIPSGEAPALVNGSEEGTSASESDSEEEEEEEDDEEMKEEEPKAAPKSEPKAETKPEPTKPSKKDVAVIKSPAKKQKPEQKSEQKTEQKPEQKSEQKTEKKNAQEGAKLGVKKNLGQGLAYEVLALGKGPIVTAGKNMKVRYMVNLAKSGKKVDSGTMSFRVGGGEVVPGFDKGVTGMCVNEKRRIFVPSGLAYKNKKTGNIPPNSDLVFEVTCLSSK